MDQRKLQDNVASVRELADTDYLIEDSAWRVRDMPERMRPREEMARVGAENVSDAVLLSVLLRVGTKGVNVVDLAQGLLRKYGSLTAMAAASEDDLAQARGLGGVKAQIIKAALEIGRRLRDEAMPKRFRIKTPEDAAGLLKDRLCGLDREQFWVLHLDAKNQLKSRPVNVSSGLLDASLVHPREVFRGAVRDATAAVVLVHNHPSGDTAPSAEDLRVTRQLVEAGKIMDIKVLDHVIIGKPSGNGDRWFLSMREEGVVSFHQGRL
ncbi:MAG: DNA repair protein RadC [Kiritimatiellia bacterium]|jgi:DNA repair protein RadC|nr:DNA repair protein RadC [Kiritimatiellia bacterium]MDP6848426.1 DNA repair protein RadC [Kiritimatiellia bacterium]